MSHPRKRHGSHPSVTHRLRPARSFKPPSNRCQLERGFQPRTPTASRSTRNRARPSHLGVASVDVLGADGTVETITGTTIHPVWSVDRQEWVPLAELAQGERLQGLDGLAVVLGVSLARVSQPVYNIEVHGEHVYQVGELGLVVHIDDVANLFASTPGHAGTHTLALVDCLIDVMIDRHSTESMISYPVSLGF